MLLFETVREGDPLVLPEGSALASHVGRTLALRFDRRITTASRVVKAVMDQIEVVDFTMQEPDLTGIVREIYGGALQPEATV